MKILVDENIPYGRELFGHIGQVELVPGREVDAGYSGLEDVGVMAIRSVTDITADLVDAAPNLKVVGTATIGTDHIDSEYIQRANEQRENPIHVFSAPGSNADSVADHILYAILHLTRDAERPLAEMSLGIVGHGNCGSRVARRAAGFGMRIVRNDPPLAERDPAFRSDALDLALQCDFVTMHVPFTTPEESEYPTDRMIGEDELRTMREDAWFMNASRGGVVDSDALVRGLREGWIRGAALDVYEGEPEPARDLIELPELATPHIAGYAIEAKRRGAAVIYEAACRVLGLEPVDTQPLIMEGFDPPEGRRVGFDASGPAARAADRALRVLLKATDDIEAVSDELKATLGDADRAAQFDAMRKNYESHVGRHELSAYTVQVEDSVEEPLTRAIAERLAGFGVEVVPGGGNYALVAE
jgi:erythronate-4-phosphate dehydrogenase